MAYLGTWPSTVGFQTTRFQAISNTKQTVSDSGRRIRISTAGSRFGATLKYPPITLANFLPIQALATRCQGSLNSFDIVLPTISANSRNHSASTTAAATSAGSSTVALTASGVNSTQIFNQGDVIRFASHNKVYMLTANATTNGSGQVTVSITPNLFEDVAGSSAVTVDDVPFRVTLVGDVQEFRYATNDTISYEIDILEEI
jgi:hypothetical protein|tara:strand:- start:100 stop:705 length:606 start_codon:yes stop_codon:yes gene_type:complete